MKTVIKSCLAFAVALFAMSSCSSKAEASQTENKTEMNKKVLIVYFSHAGENYSVGNIEVGNTKLVADEIQKVTNGDEFEIVADKSYDMPYDDLTKLAKKELESGELPSFKGGVDNIGQYDIVFIGGPVWWGTYPQVMFSFFKKYDLTGKTLIPFTTHEGSGLGSVVEDLKEIYPNAKYGEAFSVYGHEVRKDMNNVNQWLKRLGY